MRIRKAVRTVAAGLLLALAVAAVWFVRSDWFTLNVSWPLTFALSDRETAKAKLRPLADKGVPEAQYYLALTYLLSGKSENNDAKALWWYRKAADQGHAPAQAAVGRMYDDGFHDGERFRQDYAEALKWYRLAADQCDMSAEDRLGRLYAIGYGVERDFTKAAEWYRKAAEQGSPWAQYELATMYRYGHAGVKDDVQAYLWYSLAESEGYEDTAVERQALATRMTPGQIAEAERLVEAWRARDGC